jgi:hypothetical protein
VKDLGVAPKFALPPLLTQIPLCSLSLPPQFPALSDRWIIRQKEDQVHCCLRALAVESLCLWTQFDLPLRKHTSVQSSKPVLASVIPFLFFLFG